MKKLFYILAVLAAVSSCVYPFEPDILPEGGQLVVEGDIVLGDVSVIKLSAVNPIRGTAGEQPKGDAYIEDDKGGVYRSYGTLGSTIHIDTREAPADRKYRLRIDISNPGGEWDSSYTTGWEVPQAEPEISAMEMAPDDEKIVFNVSMNAPDGSSGCYRWDYELDWEYDAKYYPTYMFEDGNLIDLSKSPGTYPYHTCYSHKTSIESGLAIAKSLEGQRLYRHEYLEIPRTSTIVMKRLAILLKARCISVDCYEYLNNLKENSNATGSLFTTIPSGMRGNIRSVDDSTHFAVGYVGVSKVRMLRTFFDVAPYHISRWKYGDDLFVPEINFLHPDLNSWYQAGFLPVDDQGASGGGEATTEGVVRWGPAECVDCRVSGGTIEVPYFWER